MQDHVVFDIEIQKTIEELPDGWNSTELMGVSVACVWEYRTRRMLTYGPEDIVALKTRLLYANRITSFNGWNFDYPVVWGVGKEEWRKRDGFVFPIVSEIKTELLPKTNDLLRRIWKALDLDPDCFDKRTHGGWGLDVVAQNTLGVGKTGYGGYAPQWFQAGQWARLVTYCADDVALTRDLSDFIDRYGYVIGENGLKVRL